MRPASSYALTFWLRSEELMSSDRQNGTESRLKNSLTLYFCGTPVAHQTYRSSVVAASRTLAFAMRLNASAAVS
jgi:hypothetical protein